MKTHLSIALGISALLFAPALSSQRRHTTYFYHGDLGSPSSVIVHRGTGYERSPDTEITYAAAPGTEYCVVVVNSHPLNYAYSLTATVDTTTPRYDLSQPVGVLSALIARGAPDGPPVAADPAPGSDALSLNTLSWYLEAVDLLRADLEAARAALRASDRPEAIPELELAPERVTGGLRSAQARIRALPAGEGRFNDPHLQETLDAWRRRALGMVAGDTKLEAVAKLVADEGDQLARDIQQLESSVLGIAPITRVCEKVGAGPTTFKLTIAKKGTSGSATREVGDQISLMAVARPPYERPRLAVHPIAFMTTGFNVPDFRIVDGKLRGDREYATDVRVGAMVNFHLFSFAEDRQGAVGLGLGVGTGGEENLLTDLFLGPVFSFRDNVRLGLGIGSSEFPRRVRGGVVGEPFTASGELDELIEKERTLALQLVFVLPGLKLQ